MSSDLMVPVSKQALRSTPNPEKSLSPQQWLSVMPWSRATSDAILTKASCSAGRTLRMVPDSSSLISFP